MKTTFKPVPALPALRAAGAVALLGLLVACQSAAPSTEPSATASRRPSQQELDAGLQRAVQSALKPLPAGTAIDVQVRQSMVALVGQVPNIEQRLRLVEAAKGVPGVRAVVRFIDILPPQLSDREVETSVLAALRAHPATASTRPVVTVTNGIVALAGYGSEWQIRHVARRIAEKIPGVKEVLVPICLPYEASIEDELQKVVARRLASAGLPAIEIAVTDGRVSLAGEVPTVTDKLAAMTQAFNDSVRTVHAQSLHVANPASTPPPAALIQRYLQQALLHDPRIHAAKIAVEVSGGTVRLDGSTPDLKSRQLAAWLAASTPGVQQIENKIGIRTDPARTDKELAENLREALLSDPSVDLYQLAISVVEGRVLVRGNASTPREKWRAADIARQVHGIVAVDNALTVTHTTEPRVLTTNFFKSTSFTSAWWTLESQLDMPDADLQQAVVARLAWDPTIDSRNIQVAAAKGTVTLTGPAQSDAAIEAAYEAGATHVDCRPQPDAGP